MGFTPTPTLAYVSSSQLRPITVALGFGLLLHLPEQAPVVTAKAVQPWPCAGVFFWGTAPSNMVNLADEPASTSAVLRVDVELEGQVSTYWVGSAGLAYPGAGPAATAAFYLNAGRLLSDLRKIDALDSPTEGTLIDRVSRLGRMIAVEPALEAAIGFHVQDGATGLITVAYVGRNSTS